MTRQIIIDIINIIEAWPDKLTQEDYEFYFNIVIMGKAKDVLVSKLWLLKKLKEYREDMEDEKK